MRAPAVAAVVAFALLPVGAGASDASLQPQADLPGSGQFCTQRPADVDQTVPAAVNALSVSAPDTPPIAVLDTGVDGDVPELAGRTTASAYEALGGGTDGSDIDGHGTEVAGIAAGAPGLVRGVSVTSPIMPVRLYNPAGATSVQALIAGVGWAADHGAGVINISSAGPLSEIAEKDVAAMTRAISQAFNKGVIVVAAVGNDGKEQADFPASLPHVLAVGGSDTTGVHATFSNLGPWLDLVSPASGLTAPMPKNFCESGYGFASGTSFAAPAVAGAAALLEKLRPELTVQQRFDVLRNSAHDVEFGGRDDETGFGLLDVQAAIKAAAPAKDSSAEVDDDPYFVRGPFAAAHPTLLLRSNKTTVSGTLSEAKDPSDVYPVSLRKGQRLVVSGSVKGSDDADALLRLWKPKVGDFDVSNDVSTQLLADSGGFSPTPRLSKVVPAGGTYYLSVEASDIDTTDTSTAVPASETYKLTLAKQNVKKKPKKKKTKKRA